MSTALLENPIHLPKGPGLEALHKEWLQSPRLGWRDRHPREDLGSQGVHRIRVIHDCSNPPLLITLSDNRQCLGSLHELYLFLAGGRGSGLAGPSTGGSLRTVGSSAPLICSLFQEVLEHGGASLLEVALLIAVVALGTGGGTLPRVRTSTFQGCNETGVTRHRGLKSAPGMSRQVHQDEGRLLVGDM